MLRLKLVVSIFALVFGGFVMWQTITKTNVTTESTPQSPQVLGAPDNTGFRHSLEYRDSRFTVNWKKVDPLRASLYPNFQAQEPAIDLYEKYECSLLINGGFYTQEGNPTGLFVSNGDKLFSLQSNTLFNGILSINYFDTPRITHEVPKDQLREALQTGPVLIENSSTLELNLKRDKLARRSVAAVTGSNELVFMIIASEGSSFGGPYLEDLPNLVKKIGSDLNLNIADAINLDGGSASAFYMENVKISELSPIGSFFCVK